MTSGRPAESRAENAFGARFGAVPAGLSMARTLPMPVALRGRRGAVKQEVFGQYVIFSGRSLAFSIQRLTTFSEGRRPTRGRTGETAMVFRSEDPPPPANLKVDTPPDAERPTTAMLKGDIDSGRTGDKVVVVDQKEQFRPVPPATVAQLLLGHLRAG